MLEAAQHETNSFVTLTYSDDHLPGNLSVSPRELTLFVKRLRKISPFKIRYFACGEYGDQSARPHYHLALFGYPNCLFVNTRILKAYCCENCARISDAWGFGQVFLGTIEQNSAAYIAGYIVKKYTKTGPLNGREPEFARMSLRPGIGLGMMHEVASTLLAHKLDERMIDVPLALQHGRTKWPLGRYLRRKLRTFIGRDANAPAQALQAQELELSILRQAAWDTKTSVKTQVLNKSLGKRIQIENRHRHRKKNETL